MNIVIVGMFFGLLFYILYVVFREGLKPRGTGGTKIGGTAKLAHNRRGEHLIIDSNGNRTTDINALLRNPKVQEDLRAVGRLYKTMVLKALYLGEEPPKQYGDFLPMNKERLLAEWDEDWQAVMDNTGLDYNTFFDIPEEPELTAEEIAAHYVEKDKKEGIGENTLRKYAGSDRSLRL